MESAAHQALKQRQRLKELIEIYALRARLLSEGIAVLGGHVTAQRPINETIVELKNMSLLVEQAGADLFAFVGAL
jgi:hypothetical protein